MSDDKDGTPIERRTASQVRPALQHQNAFTQSSASLDIRAGFVAPPSDAFPATHRWLEEHASSQPIQLDRLGTLPPGSGGRAPPSRPIT
jgi:hypothetical protein